MTCRYKKFGIGPEDGLSRITGGSGILEIVIQSVTTFYKGSPQR